MPQLPNRWSTELVIGAHTFRLVARANGTYESVVADKIDVEAPKSIKLPDRPLVEEPWLIVEVLSHTDPDTTYTVKLYEAYATCECKGFSFRRACSHIDEVLDGLSN